jgi:hypothetical protein
MRLYTAEIAGSGQYGICAKCNKSPTKEGYDGCIGELPRGEVMNACCGHGKDDQAYVQRWQFRKLVGEEAIDYINSNRRSKWIY